MKIIISIHVAPFLAFPLSLSFYPHPQAAILLLLIPLTTTNCLSTSIPPLLCSPLLASVDENISHADILIATCGNILEMLSRSVNFLVIPIFTRRIVRNCDYVRTKFRLCNFSPSYRNDLYVKYSKRHRSVIGDIQFLIQSNTRLKDYSIISKSKRNSSSVSIIT